MCALAAALFVVVAAAPARAQQRGFVSAGAFLTWQPEGQSDCPYLCGPLGGSSVGVRLAAGVQPSPAVGVGAEISMGGALSGEQIQRVIGGAAQTIADHRDLFADAIIRFSPSAGRGAAVMLVAGAGIAHRMTDRTGTISQSLLQNPPPPRAVSERISDTVFHVTGGIGVPVSVARRVALVPSIRLHYVIDNDRQPDGVVKRGVSSWMIWSGVAIEGRF